jgi:hypothetical protein
MIIEIKRREPLGSVSQAAFFYPFLSSRSIKSRTVKSRTANKSRQWRTLGQRSMMAAL